MKETIPGKQHGLCIRAQRGPAAYSARFRVPSRCAEIDLSVASIANATGIVVAYVTTQDPSVTRP
jgi:hypothetical protein